MNNLSDTVDYSQVRITQFLILHTNIDDVTLAQFPSRVLKDLLPWQWFQLFPAYPCI